MTTWSMYRVSDGQFIGHMFSGMEQDLELNVPEGCAAMVGTHDHLTTRVDLSTKEVVSFTPPLDRQRTEAADAVRERIRGMEAKQNRPLREAALGDLQALDKVRAIETEIAAQRLVLAAIGAATTEEQLAAALAAG